MYFLILFDFVAKQYSQYSLLKSSWVSNNSLEIKLFY